MFEHQQQQKQQQQQQCEQDLQLTDPCKEVTSGAACHGDDTFEEDWVGEKLVLVRCNDSITDGSTADVEDDALDDVPLGSRRKLKKKKLKKTKKKNKKPPFLFQSDFMGSSSSSDDYEVARTKRTVNSIHNQNPADLGWIMWVWYYIVMASASVFHGAEFCGEKLADFFGITFPKYNYTINEYHRMKEEEKEGDDLKRIEAECVRQRHLKNLSNIEMANLLLPQLRKQKQQHQQHQEQHPTQRFFQPRQNHSVDERR